MYPNLDAEMARRKITITDIAKTINCSYETTRKKLKGQAPFLLKEARRIKQEYFSNEMDMSLEKLFEEQEAS